MRPASFRYSVTTSDPSVGVAWYEDDTLCCTGDALGTCRMKGVAEASCAAQTREGRMLAFRALTTGEVELIFRDAEGNEVARLSITGQNLERWLIDAGVEPVATDAEPETDG